MTPTLVLDASATLAWLLNENQLGPMLDPLISRHRLIAPWLWRAEVANTLLVLHRRRIVTAQQVAGYAGDLDALSIEFSPEPADRSIQSLVDLAKPYQLTSYDALYLELAFRQQSAMLTNDRNLASACQRMGIALPWNPLTDQRG